MTCRRHTPRGDGNRVTDPGAEPINKPAKAQQPEGIGQLERRIGVAELGVAPAQFFVQILFAQGKNLPVNIVDGRREEQQGANDPPIMAEARSSGLAPGHWPFFVRGAMILRRVHRRSNGVRQAGLSPRTGRKPLPVRI